MKPVFHRSRLGAVFPRESIYIEYMGCPQRGLDARRLADYFFKNGVVISKNPKNAGYILFITCACKKNDEDVAIERIKELGRYRGKLIVGGCLKAIHKDRLGEFFQGLTLATSEIDQIDRLFPHFLEKFREIPDPNRPYPKNKLQMIKHFFRSFTWDLSFIDPVMDYFKRKNSPKYWFVRAGWGCIQEHCTYCSVWKAVGELKSKPLDECMKEFEEGLRRGYKHILFSADNLGAYGLDINTDLPGLLRRVTAVKGQYSVELENCHPRWIIKYLDAMLPVLRSSKIELIRCAIQSGNDRILKLMNRGHTREEITKSLLRIKDAHTSLKLHTQIIVGFPSETEAEFNETLACVKETGFQLVFISGYCRPPGFSSGELIKQEVSRAEIERRIAQAKKFFKKNKIACFVYSL